MFSELGGLQAAFENLIIDPARAFAAAALLSLFGLVIWWLKRKRQKRVWLPTMRVMTLETRLMPKLLLRPPPLLAFLAFLAAAATVVGFVLKPRTQVFTPFEPNQTRIHLFADMSPSVSAYVSLDEYAQKLSALYASLKDSGRVTLSFSNAITAIEPKSEAEVVEAVQAAGFHRAGLKLGTALKTLVEDLGEVDRLFIVTDRDQSTWAGFNWRYLADDMHVVFYDLSAGESRDNAYIADARYTSLASSNTMDWEVEVARRAGEDDDLKGTLSVIYRQKTLTATPFKIAASKQRVAVRATWPMSLIDKKGMGLGKDADAPLIFKIDVDGGPAVDAVLADDEFRAKLTGLKQNVLIVGGGEGERTLLDPVSSFQTALEVLGFRVKRHDFAKDGAEKLGDYPLWALVGGGGDGIDRFCPKSLGDERRKAVQAAKAWRGTDGKGVDASVAGAGPESPAPAANGDAAAGVFAQEPKLWLMPVALDADYKELCDCYARIFGDSNQGEGGGNDYCANMSSRNQWVGLLPSLGFKQVGGSLGAAHEALAWSHKDPVTGLAILAFSVPLAPLPGTGMGHAQLPILVRELLTWQGILEGREGRAAAMDQSVDARAASINGLPGFGWPRVDDLAVTAWKHPYAEGSPEGLRLKATNVPIGESQMGREDEANLPPRWSPTMDLNVNQLTAKKDREDPLPWLRLAVLILLAAAAVEALMTLGLWVYRAISKKADAPARTATFGALLVAALGGLGSAPRAEAKVDFGVIGAEDLGGGLGLTINMLAREVSHRTSIELTTRPGNFSTPDAAALLEPWLWSKDVQAVTNKDGTLKGDVTLWLKRGGLLVIEAETRAVAPAELAKLTQKIAHQGEDEAGWLPLPPDHELMRSFYLLDALPACGPDIWRGFHYDGRLAILYVPYGFLASLKDRARLPTCANPPDHERSVRIFVNLIMVALATDYKKDQIHLPEILKRLR